MDRRKFLSLVTGTTAARIFGIEPEPKKVAKIGKAKPATPEEIREYQELLNNTYLDPNQTIVWSHVIPLGENWTYNTKKWRNYSV